MKSHHHFFQATLDAMEEAVALDERLKAVARCMSGLKINQSHLTRIRQRLYASLDDGRSETAAGEREKLASLGPVRDAVGRLAHVCRPEIVGREVPAAAAHPDQPAAELGEFRFSNQSCLALVLAAVKLYLVLYK
jgi:hypothetical protein